MKNAKNVILFLFSFALIGMMSCEEAAIGENSPIDVVAVSNDKGFVDSTIESNLIFIGSIIIIITSESVCFWEDFFIEEDETKILPFIAGVAAVDCLGAIARVWWKATTDLCNGNYEVDQGEYGNAALGGAVTSSGFRLFGL